MPDFREDAHPRDDKGRFTAGSLSTWSKNRPKNLSGFSGEKGEAKGRVEGRQRDIEIPLISKRNGSFASTGNLPMDEKTHQAISDFLSMKMGVKGGANRYKAFKTAERTYKSAVTAKSKLEDKLKAITSAAPSERAKLETFHGATVGELQKKIDKKTKLIEAKKKEADAAYMHYKNEDYRNEALKDVREALDHALSKNGVDRFRQARLGSTEEGEWNGSRHNPIKLEGWKSSEATINAQVDHHDGTIDIHIAAPSKDPKYPGDKELHLTVKPERITKEEDAWDPDQLHGAKHMDARVETISTQYPSDERGKAHPNEVNIENDDYGVKAFFYLPDALREHIQKFRES